MIGSTRERPASRILILVLGVAVSVPLSLTPPVHAAHPGTTFLNLDFEVAPAPGQAKGWFQRWREYEVTVDSEIAHSGERSLRIRSLVEDPAARAFGVATSSFPVADAAGKTIRFSGWIRAENVQDRRAGLGPWRSRTHSLPSR